MTAPTLDAPAPAIPTGRISTGPQGYRDWRGQRKDRLHRLLALATGEAMANLKNVASLVLTIFTGLYVLGVTFALISALYFLGQFADPESPLVSFGGAYMATYMMVAVIPAMVVLSAGLGSKLIADDFASRSIVLYFCRPLHRTDYLVGKLLSLEFILIFFSLVPALIFNISGLSIGTIDAIDRNEKLWTLPVTVLISLLCIVFWGTLGLAFSAFFKRRGWAFAAVLALVLFSFLFSNLLVAITHQNMLSYFSLIDDWHDVLNWVYQQPDTPGRPPAGAAAVLGGVLALCWGLMFHRMSVADIEVES